MTDTTKQILKEYNNEVIDNIFANVEEYFNCAINNGKKIEAANSIEKHLQDNIIKSYEATKQNILRIIKVRKL